jgi:hypothetical protein
MVAVFFRAVLWALVVTGLALPAAAQSQVPQQMRVPAPDRHPATGLVFPPQISTAQKTYSLDYGKAMQRPELGYAWNYQMPQLLSATVYIYTMNVQTITDGPTGAPVVAQFQQSLQEIYDGARIGGRYEQLKTVKGPTDCPLGSIVFRCITLSGINSSKQHVFTALMVTGYRGNFLKLRLDWRENSELSQAAVDRFVQTLVGAMMR